MALQSSRIGATVSTPLGSVSVQVSGPPGMTLDVAQARVPELPEGMAVDGVVLVHIGLAAPVTRRLPVRVRTTVGRDGSPETGEWLDSMAFESAEGVLQVATRDSDWLGARGIVAEPIRYEPQGFRQTISEAPGGSVICISVVWRLRDGAAVADNVSAWFAADLALLDCVSAGGRDANRRRKLPNKQETKGPEPAPLHTWMTVCEARHRCSERQPCVPV